VVQDGGAAAAAESPVRLANWFAKEPPAWLAVCFV